MPTYDFRCPDCRAISEVVSKVSLIDLKVMFCTTCDIEMVRLINAPGIVFKGSGWAGKVNHGTHKTSEKQPTASVKPEGDQSTAGDPAS